MDWLSWLVSSPLHYFVSIIVGFFAACIALVGIAGYQMLRSECRCPRMALRAQSRGELILRTYHDPDCPNR